MKITARKLRPGHVVEVGHPDKPIVTKVTSVHDDGTYISTKLECFELRVLFGPDQKVEVRE